MYDIYLNNERVLNITFKTRVRALSALKSFDINHSKKPYEIIESIVEEELVNCFRCDTTDDVDNMLNTDIGYLCEGCEGDLR